MVDRKQRKSIPPAGSNVTLDSPADYTSDGDAPNRAFVLNAGFIKIGSVDPLQGAALFLSVVLTFILLVVALVGLSNPQWAKDVLVCINSLLSMVVGVAIGRGSEKWKSEKLK